MACFYINIDKEKKEDDLDTLRYIIAISSIIALGVIFIKAISITFLKLDFK